MFEIDPTTKMQDCNGCVLLCRPARGFICVVASVEILESLIGVRSSCPSPTLMLISRTFSSMIIFLILKDHFRLPHVILDTEFAFLKKQDQKDYLSSNSYIGDRCT